MTTRCVACGGETTPLPGLRWTFDGVEYGLLRCSSCGGMQTAPLPSDQTLERLYAHSFDYRWYRDHLPAKIRDCRERIAEYRPLLSGRILDFGGGLGYLSRLLREEGFNSVTWDPYCGGDAPPGGAWDTVIALHVLEHSNDPDRTLSHISSLMRPDATLILAVPNAAGEGYRTRGAEWVWAQPPLIHTLHFTETGLKSLLSRHGYDIREVRYAERWDANRISDLEELSRQSLLDGLWGRQPWNRFTPYRRIVATVASLARLRALRRLRREHPVTGSEGAELQVVARWRG